MIKLSVDLGCLILLTSVDFFFFFNWDFVGISLL